MGRRIHCFCQLVYTTRITPLPRDLVESRTGSVTYNVAEGLERE